MARCLHGTNDLTCHLCEIERYRTALAAAERANSVQADYLRETLHALEDAGIKCSGPDFVAGGVKELLVRHDSAKAEVERLRGVLDRIHALDDFPELTSTMRTGLFCGVEDRNLTDRYEGAGYGWEDAAERCAEWAKNMSALTPAPQQEKHRD